MVKKGDKVSFFHQTGEGTIMRIINDELAKVDMGDGFETPVLIKELIKISPENIDRFEDEIRNSLSFAKGNATKNKDKDLKKPEKGVKKTGSERSRTKHIAPEEIDLHIEELIDDHTGLTNAEIIVIQLNYFRKCLDDAIFRDKRKIIFIHGVGKGTLKKEMVKILKTYENITFYDASYARHGFGATEVVIE